MNESINPLNDLKEIRSIMEKSSRFISLSGLSGIFAGIFALIGAAAAYWYLDKKYWSSYKFIDVKDLYLFFFTDTILVVILALASGLYFTIKQAKRKGQKIWDKTSQRLLINTAIPLVAGGIFCLALLYHGEIYLIAPSMLIFYGLALINGSKFTLTDIRYLGLVEVALGLLSCFYIGYGLLFWVIGFGIMHIVYGTVMYFRYER